MNNPGAKTKKRALSSRDIARLCAQASYDTKAEDIVVIDLRKLPSFTDFFVLATGQSDRQVQSICDNIEEVLGAKGIQKVGVEGYEKGHWVLIDYGPVVAHIFYPETREFYALEKFWSDAPRVRFRLK